MKVNKLDKWITISLVSGMVSSIYLDSVFSLYTLCTLLLMLRKKITDRLLKIEYPIFLWVMFILFILIHLYRVFLCGGHFPIGLLMYLLFFGFYYSYISKDLLLKYYKCFAYIVVFVFFIQYFGKNFLDFPFSGFIPFIPLNIGDERFIQDDYVASIISEDRCNSIFAEPSHFAQFLLPIICIDLFYSTDKNRLKRLLIWVIPIILTKSGVGAVGLLLILVTFGIYFIKNKSIATVVITCFCLAVPLILGTHLFLNSEYATEMLARSEEFTGVDDHVSAYVRVIRGFVLYGDMPFYERLIGIDSNMLENRIRAAGLELSYAKDAGAYMNLCQNFLIREGLIVFLPFIIGLLITFGKLNWAGKAILVVFIGLSFMESMHFTPTFQLFIITALSMNKKMINKHLVNL